MGSSLGTLCPKQSYILKSVRVVHIVIVEDVLVLVRERDRLVHLVHLASLVQTGPPPAADQPVQVKGVALFIRLLREFVVGVLFQVVLGRIERGQAPELQDAPVTGHGGKFAGGHQLFATMSSDEFKNGQKIPLLFTKEGNTTLFKS